MINKSFKFVLVLLLLLFTPWLQAQTPTVTVELGDVLEATPNTLITVPINVTNFNNVGSYDFNIYWNSNELELVKNPEPQYTTNALYNYTTKKLNGQDGDNYLRIVDGSVSPFSVEDGSLILLTFYVKTGANGTGTIDIYDNQGVDNPAPAGKENSTVQSVDGVNLLSGAFQSTVAFTQTTLLNPTVVFANAREDGSGNLLVDIYGKNVRNIIGLTLAVDFEEADVPNTTGSEVLLPNANMHSTIQGNGYFVRNVVHDGMKDFENEVPANTTRLMFEWVQPDLEVDPDGLVEGALTLIDDAVNYAGVIATLSIPGLTVSDLTRVDLVTAKLNRVDNTEVDGLINVNTNITVYLQDFYNTGSHSMNGTTGVAASYSYTDDNTGYSVSENTDVDFSGANIVDWIYVELRQANSAQYALEGTRKTGEEQYGNGEYKFIQGKLGLLTTAGTILGADGKQFSFQDIPEGDYYVYVKHDQHKEVVSFGASEDGLPTTFTDANGATFNFTNGPGKAYGYDPEPDPDVLPQAEVENDVYAAYAYGPPVLAAFPSGAITNVGTTSFTATGTVTDDGLTPITERGFVYSTTANPTTADGKVAAGTASTGEYTVDVTGLNVNTMYYVRPYAINKNGTTYGTEQTVSTNSDAATLATLTMADVLSLEYNMLTIQGTVSNDGGETVTNVGFVWGTTSGVTLDGTNVSTLDMTDAGTTTPITFDGTLSPLDGATTYYIKSYAITAFGTAYSNELEVTTPAGFLYVDAKAFLQGAYDDASDEMTVALNSGGLLPLNSAASFDGTTYNYTTETVGAIPNADVVDWVLVTLRSDLTTTVATQPAFILKDGSIVDVDGSSNLAFGGIDVQADYYIVLRHKTHLAIMSAAAVTNVGGVLTYDFTDDQAKAYNTGTGAMAEVETGVFGLITGDANRDGNINATDYNSNFLSDNGQPFDYEARNSDFNLDGNYNATDYNGYFIPSNGQSTQVPN